MRQSFGRCWRVRGAATAACSHLIQGLPRLWRPLAADDTVRPIRSTSIRASES